MKSGLEFGSDKTISITKLCGRRVLDFGNSDPMMGEGLERENV